MVEVKITGLICTSQYGNLSAGDILRTSKEFADHLVNDCNAAVYLSALEGKAAPGKGEGQDSGSNAPAVQVKAKGKGK